MKTYIPKEGFFVVFDYILNFKKRIYNIAINLGTSRFL